MSLILLSLLSACSGTSGKDSAPGGTDTGTAADDSGTTGDTGNTDTGKTDTGTLACASLSTGDDWAWNGQCPQMRTPCDIVADGCAFTIDYAADGGMTMGMPTGGTIAGDTVTFSEDNGVTGCTGTVIDADTVEGTCDGGCTFTLSR